MIIPEIIIYNTVNKFLDFIKSDYDGCISSPACSMLYKMFYADDNGDEMKTDSDYDWLENAKNILLRTDENPRKIGINMGYNMDRAAYPTVHILLPSQSNGKFETTGQGETDYYKDDTNSCTGRLYADKKTTHNATYNLMLTSENVNEVLIMYYFLLDMFVILNDHFGLKGLINLRASGQDVQVQNDLVPPNIFHRNLSINFDYETVTTILTNSTLVGGLQFSVCSDIGDDNLENP